MTNSHPPFTSATPTQSEIEQVKDILSALNWDENHAVQVQHKTTQFIQSIRAKGGGITDIETFLQNYPLASAEGRALMTLAEALLRVPDADTANELIAEKIGISDWKKLGGHGYFAALSNFGLGMAKSMLGGFLSGVSKPVIRKATTEMVRRLGSQFVVGETIEAALKQAQKVCIPNTRMSFDMLGEGARTEEDAARYFAAYEHALKTIAAGNQNDLPMTARHGMSVKLSALHPRYTWTQADTCVPEITDRLLSLCKMASSCGMTLTVDAEESERLELHLDIFRRVALAPELKGWEGLGLAVQAYDRRSADVIDYIIGLARSRGARLQMRLVKGAYWDGEIKRAQVAGWAQYPVFTRKSHTDLSYLYAAQKMLAARDVLYPMFATHNAGTASAIINLAGSNRAGFEMQRLYGMGQALGDILVADEHIPVTYYAPVGSYEDLLPYLVRRMLENGANSSFVSQIRNDAIPPEVLARDVVAQVKSTLGRPLPLALPAQIYGADRLNSKGYDLSRQMDRDAFFALLKSIDPVPRSAEPQIDDVFAKGLKGFVAWSKTSAETRATTLRKAANLLEHHTGELITLLQSEGKKTLFDAIAEIREAVDFCRYYAAEGEKTFGADGHVLKGPTGERNSLKLAGRGVFVTISPWNFPLAIFLGQVSAALMAGNSVVAKPAEQTPLVARFAVGLLHQAGVPKDALQMVEGDGKIGAELVAHPDVAGVAFTGSTEVARLINRSLSAKDGAIVPLIAETGGQNAMIVDSTALPEQVADDVLLSAFGSAGQRCSALRVLFVQDDIADKVIHLLQGAMAQLKVGAPQDIRTDVPSVIDRESQQAIKAHKAYLDSFAKMVATAPDVTDPTKDTYIIPRAYEIDSIRRLKHEVFGPVLHIIRFKSGDIEKIIDDINATGFGLTFGFHSRLHSRHELVAKSIRAGNIYINRNMIGAVVGVQPFGGQGLSGTGPKAGGPHYLPRFATEVTVTDNIMASGGNVDLLSSLEE